MTACPAAGPSTTITSAARARWRAFTFPSTRISFIPGTAVATMSSAPVFTSRLDIFPRPWVSRYSMRASSAARGRTRQPGIDLPLLLDGLDAEHRGQPRLALQLDEQHLAAGPGGRHGQGGGRRRFAHAALPGQDDHPGRGAPLGQLHRPNGRDPRCDARSSLSWPCSPWPCRGPRAAGAAEVAQDPERHMDVVQVQGAIDPVVADLIKDSIRRAQTNGATVVVLQVDSQGALDTDPVALDRRRAGLEGAGRRVGRPREVRRPRCRRRPRRRRLVLGRLPERPARPGPTLPPRQHERGCPTAGCRPIRPGTAGSLAGSTASPTGG